MRAGKPPALGADNAGSLIDIDNSLQAGIDRAVLRAMRQCHNTFSCGSLK